MVFMIGIDISDRSIKVVRLSNDQRHKLLSYGWKKVPDGLIDKGEIQDSAAVGKVIKSALEASNVSLQVKDSVVASIPETESFLRVLEIPAMREDEIDEAIQWEVASHIPFGVDNVYLDWQWAGASKRANKKREVLVGAAEKKVVNPLFETLSSLGLDVAALELEGQAIVRALVSKELRRNKNLLIIDSGGAVTNIVIFRDNAIRFTATLSQSAFGLVSNLPAEELKLVSGKPGKMPAAIKSVDKIMPALNDLAVQVHALVESYQKNNPDQEIHQILLTGGGSSVPGMGQSFSQYFPNIHIQRANPWVNILPGRKHRPPLPLAESVHYSTALGLALRNELR